jgi:protein associated with RNAse G/E
VLYRAKATVNQSDYDEAMRHIADVIGYAESLERIVKDYQQELTAFIETAEKHLTPEKTSALKAKLYQIESVLKKTGE